MVTETLFSQIEHITLPPFFSLQKTNFRQVSQTRNYGDLMFNLLTPILFGASYSVDDGPMISWACPSSLLQLGQDCMKQL